MSGQTSGLCYVVLGLGMGFLMQMVSLIAQNSVEPRNMGVASSARMFFHQMGRAPAPAGEALTSSPNWCHKPGTQPPGRPRGP